MSNPPLQWVPGTDKTVLDRMFQEKLRLDYIRPSHLDTIAKQAIVVGERSTCLWYQVGALIFAGDLVLSSGYNGAARGDVDPREVGCARVVGGKLQEGKGFCRGSHAELNAISQLSAGTMGVCNLEMMVTLHPCYACAKQIRNKQITKVYYLWEYGREPHVTEYLQAGGIKVEKYTSPHLERWIAANGYHAVGALAPPR
jgi:dCMP deaminase